MVVVSRIRFAVACLLVSCWMHRPFGQEEEEVTCDANGVCTSIVHCQDYADQCEAWASQGKCEMNRRFMLRECPKSCFVCGEDNVDDPGDGSAFGMPQVLGNDDDGISPEQAKERLTRVTRYMQHSDIGSELKAQCRNLHAECINWAVGEECIDDPIWMQQECAPACMSCEYLAYTARCPMDMKSIPDAWAAGDLNAMFEKLTNEPYLSQYSVETLSSPATGGPWVIQLENVLSPEEADHLIELGGIEGYQRSGDVGKVSAVSSPESRRISQSRTSSTAWCRESCSQNATAVAVMDRLSYLTGIPRENSESLQLLRYEPGQFYVKHHDYLTHHMARQQGPRILTFFLYLNNVTAGGETEFNLLDVVVTPRLGRAILWPSVLDESPMHKDGRTMHAALAVEEGIKYGANAWLHLRDFQGPNGRGCS